MSACLVTAQYPVPASVDIPARAGSICSTQRTGDRPPKRGELVVRYGQGVGVWVCDVEAGGQKADCRDNNIQNNSEIELDSNSHCLKTVVCRHDGPFW